MKFPTNPTPSPNINPGIKNDRGRIILILIVAGISYWIYSSWADWQNTWNEIMSKIGSEFGIFEEEPVYEFEETDSLPETQPVPREPAQPAPVYETNFSDDMSRQILQDSREQIIQQLREQGQEDQIPMVLEALEKFEREL